MECGGWEEQEVVGKDVGGDMAGVGGQQAGQHDWVWPGQVQR